MTALLIGFGLSLLAGVLIGGYRIHRHAAWRQLDLRPEWINKGRKP